jgi:hypothetical protein
MLLLVGGFVYLRIRISHAFVILIICHVLKCNIRNYVIKVGFEVLTAASMKMAVFWAVAPCSLVEVTIVSEILATCIIRAINGRGRSLIALMMEAGSTCETLVNFYHTTRRYNPEDSYLLMS